MNYTALTIGPIYKTLHSVKSTKAIWAASYMFSYLIKEIIKAIDGKAEFILPYSDEIVINGNTKKPLNDCFQTGLFPDRLIINGNIELQQIIDDVIKNFSIKSGIREDYLKNYINTYHLTLELGEKENIIIKINELLDSLELQQRVLEKADNDYLRTFFEDVYYNFLIENEFEGDEKRFPSTIEIAKSEYKDIDEKKFRHLVNILFKVKKNSDIDSVDTQKQFIEKISYEDNFKNTIRNYQKYIAVVQADGDNIGTFIKFLYEQENKNELIERFSKNLLSFAIEAVELIKAYRGTPIYAGGDDLLFFAPVAHTQYNADNKTVSINKTILTLIKQLDDKFDVYFKKEADFGKLMNDQEAIKKFEEKGEKFKHPTMSYGVSISYYKFPLNQALEEGVNQLFHIAKKTDKKNAVSYTILKHSGQYFGTTFHKDEASYTNFTELLKHTITGENFIHSIIYKLDPQKEVLKEIGKKDKPEREKMLDSFFLNNFNESVHRDKDNRNKLIPFLEKTKQLFWDVYSEHDLKDSKLGIDKQNELNLNKIYSTLRFIDFIHNKEERDD